MSGTPCGCCTTPGAAIPAEVANRPWLSAIAYRIGTFATFRKALTDELSHTVELAGLTARVSEDYTITAIELWAAVADVLTFYQERLANEAFLRTSTLRDSVLRLVRLIDYQLRPGAAATTQLAFTLEAGATALVPAGTRVQSVPGEGEKPQKFETLASLWADARLNKQRVFPFPSASSPLDSGSPSATVAPDPEAVAGAATLAPSDRVMLYAPAAAEVLTVSEVRSQDDVLRVDWERPITNSAFGPAIDGADPAFRAYKLGRSFRLFGFDAPPMVVVPERKVPADATTTYLTEAFTDFTHLGDGTTGTQISLDARYPGFKPGAVVLAVASAGAAVIAIPFEVAAVNDVHVERTAITTTVLATAVTALSNTVTQLVLNTLTGGTLANLFAGDDDIRNVVLYELLGDPLRFWPYDYADTVATGDVYLPGRRAGWSSVEVGRTIEKGAYKPGTRIDRKDFPLGRAVLLTDAMGGEPIAATVSAASIVGAGVSFAVTETDHTTLSQIGFAPDQAIPVTVIVSTPLEPTVSFPNTRRELTVRIGALPTQTIALDAVLVGAGAIADVAAALEAAIHGALPGAPTFAHALLWVIDDAIVVAPGIAGDEVAFGPSANDPATVVSLGLDPPRARFLDGVMSAPIGPLATSGAMTGFIRVAVGADAPVDRFIDFPYAGAVNLAAMMNVTLDLNAIVTPDDRVLVLPPIPAREPRSFLHLSLELDAPLALDAATAAVLGNVAPSSHGETVRNEIVGDGDASQPFQRFPLKKKPVTYVPDAVPGGVASSLTVLVNGVKWTEASTLYGASPRNEIYVTRIADDQTLTVQFGDGMTGARVPSGRQNIVATYRQGIGLAGRVGAKKLTTLLDRPTGVKSVTNLTAADGGADAETMARAREAAPGTVRTFGRAVSLRDFEDTALMAGEVAKASATWVWNGERRAIHLTVAAQGGAIFSADGLKRLAATLATERDPNHKLLIDNYQPVAVLVDASLLVDERHVATRVLEAARTALLDALSFDRRRFAEPVYLSDVFRILQDVEGVVAVDVNVLDLKSKDAGFRAAHGVDPTLGQPQPRLLMLPARPLGAVGAVLPAELAWVEVPAQDVTLRASGGLST